MGSTERGHDNAYSVMTMLTVSWPLSDWIKTWYRTLKSLAFDRNYNKKSKWLLLANNLPHDKIFKTTLIIFGPYAFANVSCTGMWENRELNRGDREQRQASPASRDSEWSSSWNLRSFTEHCLSPGLRLRTCTRPLSFRHARILPRVSTPSLSSRFFRPIENVHTPLRFFPQHCFPIKLIV